MRVTLMHNPDAGSGEMSREALLTALREAGHNPVYQSTKAKDAMGALDDPGELVVVAGGDGTVAKVARQLAGRAVPIAVLAAGTANNIAAALGARGDVRSQIAAWSAGRRRPFDIGIAAGPWGERRFIESVGGGLFARTMLALEAKPQPPFASPDEGIAYAIEELRRVLRRAQPRHWRVELDGADHSGRYLLVEAMNIPSVGPRLELAPDADTCDGMLDVVLLHEYDRDRFDEFLRRRICHATVRPDLTLKRAARVSFEPEGDPIHVDDQAWRRQDQGDGAGAPGGRICLHLERHALTFLVP